MPNCYCLPLYYRDNYSTNNNFHNTITKKLGLNKNQNDYAYTSEKKDNNANIFYNNLLRHEFYNDKTNQFKCKILIYQKQSGKNKTFIAKIMMQRMSYAPKITMMLMLLIPNNEISMIIKNFKERVNNIKWILYLIISFFRLLEYS